MNSLGLSWDIQQHVGSVVCITYLTCVFISSTVKWGCCTLFPIIVRIMDNTGKAFIMILDPWQPFHSSDVNHRQTLNPQIILSYFTMYETKFLEIITDTGKNSPDQCVLHPMDSLSNPGLILYLLKMGKEEHIVIYMV